MRNWRKDWEKEGEEEGEEELKKELNNTLDELNGTKGNGSNNIINIESEFDKMLFCYFTLIGISIFENNENESEIWENITTRFREGTNHTFNNKKSDKVPYSSWDFTKTYTAISNTKKLNDSIKSELIELTAHMISIRDKYNIRELNAPLEPQKQ